MMRSPQSLGRLRAMPRRARARATLGALGFAALVMAAIAPAEAATLKVQVRGQGQKALDGAVVYATPEGGVPQSPAPQTAVMDQKNRTFVPHVLVVETGTAVSFPNSDDIRHQVYSFSEAKRFQIPLYEGTPAEPIVFDRPGVVALGCNIHDRMSAFVVVVDTPWFGVTSGGEVTLEGLPAGAYEIGVIRPGRKKVPAPRTVTMSAEQTLELTLGGEQDG